MEDIPQPECSKTDQDFVRVKEELETEYIEKTKDLENAQVAYQKQLDDITNLNANLEALDQQWKNLDITKKEIEGELYKFINQLQDEDALINKSIPSPEELEKKNALLIEECKKFDEIALKYQQQMEKSASQLNIPLTGLSYVNPMEFYDYILGFTQLSQLFDGIPYQVTKRLTNEMKNQRRIGFIGQKGKGKTYVLYNILNDKDNKKRRKILSLMHGQQIETTGICLIVDENEIYFDTQAMSDAVQYFASNPNNNNEPFIAKKKEKLSFIEERNYLYEVEKKQQEMNDCQANLELFKKNFVISQCQTLIVVVSILTYEEQIFIIETMQKYPNKQIILVHNMQEVETLEQLNRKIDSDISNCYQCEKLENLEVPKEEREIAPKIYLNTGSFSKFQVQHLVLGQQSKESGIPHVCHEFTSYDLINSFSKYFQANIQNHFNFFQSQQPLEIKQRQENYLQCLEENKIQEHFKLIGNILANQEFCINFKDDFQKTPNFIKHPLQINYQGTGSDEQPYYLTENNFEFDLFIPIPFAVQGSIKRRFFVSKSFENDYQQFEFKYKQKEEHINQEVYYLINICPITQNLKEFSVRKSDNSIVKRYFMDIRTDESKLGGYKHYKFIKIADQ